MLNRTNKYDLWIITAYLLLLTKGFFTRFSILTSNSSLQGMEKLVFLLGLSLFIVTYFTFLGSTKFTKASLFLGFFVVLIMLMFLVFFGEADNGAKRFVSIAGFSFQPSLIAKVLLIFFSAIFIANKEKKNEELEDDFAYRRLDFWEQYWFDIKFFFINYWMMILPIIGIYLLVVLQPHLSILIVNGITILWMFWFGKVKTRTLLTLVVASLFVVLLVLAFGRDYRGRRIEIFKKYNMFSRVLRKDDTPISFGRETIVGEGQIRESLAALSKGKFFGTIGMSKEEYLPESSTDYIFSVIGEENGFFWTFLIIITFFIILYRTIMHSLHQKDSYKRLLLIGLGMNVFLNMLLNTGVAMSILPSTGVTLPFISSGGTSIIANSICVGMILNLSRTKQRVVK